MVLLLGAPDTKKRRVGEQAEEDEGVAVAAAAEDQEDRISALPEDLRLRILALLPLKSAIRTGALSSRWRGLWARRWPAPSSLDLHLLPDAAPAQILESLERLGRRRLDRFSLVIHPRDYGNPNRSCYLSLKDLRGYLGYAAACGVEDLHIDVTDDFISPLSTFRFPPGCSRSRLARLSLRRVGGVSVGFYRRPDAFSALEVVHLHSVRCVDLDSLLLACPRLRTLELRYCKGVRGGAIRFTPAHLRSLTVAECNNIDKIEAERASGLRSFRLSSALLPTVDLPATASLDDLYISLRGPNVGNPLSQWIRALPDLANLTVLTICSIALRRVYALARFGSVACLTKLRNLPSLRELQLLIFAMNSTSLAHIYMFFRTCRCPQLESLFVQLPTSHDDTFVDISLEAAKEDESHGKLSEEDEPNEELSKEYETEEELLEGEFSVEYMLKERLYYEDVYEEDPPDENVEEQEQSEGGVPDYGLTNLIFANMMNFKGCYFEMRLVRFLLRKATGLEKLLLVAPEGNHVEELGKERMDTSVS